MSASGENVKVRTAEQERLMGSLSDMTEAYEALEAALHEALIAVGFKEGVNDLPDYGGIEKDCSGNWCVWKVESCGMNLTDIYGLAAKAFKVCQGDINLAEY